MTAPAETHEDHQIAQEDDQDTPEEPAFGPVAAMPAETAEDQQMVPDDDRDMPEGFNVDPAGIMAGDPQSPDPAAPEQPDARAADCAAAGPGVADGADAGGQPVAAAPGAEPLPAQVSPAASDGTSSDASATRWREVLAMFVDDPRCSIELAAGLVDESAEALVISVRERQRVLLSAWQGDDAGTEEIRLTLQSYRTLWHRLEGLSRED